MSQHGTTPVLSTDRSLATFDELTGAVGAWIASYGSEATRRTYGQCIKPWLEWITAQGIEDPIRDVTKLHVELYLRKLEHDGLANNTRGLRLSVVRSWYNFLVDSEIIDASPAMRVKPPSQEEPVLDALSRSELPRFLEAIDTLGGYRHAILATMLFCGLRVSEATGANLGDIREDGWARILTVHGKGDKTRHVPLMPPAARAIEAAVEPDRTSGPLFLNLIGNRMSRHNVADAIVKAAELGGINKHLTPHSMRRSYIQVAIDMGIAVPVIQKAVGHSKPATTMSYDRRELTPEKSPGFAVMTAAA